ncbi:hypothetical protein PybrP1_012839 [[Pythium] brassicae (nom. inval.)]|nr:hypothetical protein PybrP1_012839 [[Pythium] brassicae (nom. inval.)]
MNQRPPSPSPSPTPLQSLSRGAPRPPRMAPTGEATTEQPPPPSRAQQLKRLPVDESAAAAAAARPLPPGFPSHFTMSMNVNITTSSMNNSRPIVSISAKPPASNPTTTHSSNHSNNQSSTNQSSNNSSLSPSHAQYDAGGLPPMAHVHSGGGGGRKRKSGGHSKKTANSSSSSSSKEAKDSAGSSAEPLLAPSSGASGAAKPKSPFEKLNTLKMLLDCGHLTADEYQERKTQIINEMTGTSTERKKPSPRRALQPIMKTVVPHNPPDFGRLLQERVEKLSFDVDTLEWHSTTARVKLDLVPFATGQLRNAYYLQEVEDGVTDANVTRLQVAKFSIRHADPSSYLSDVEMQAVCAHYAELYNEHEPPLRVCYARSWLLKLRDRGDLVCSVEDFLPGAYVKYSNNNGYVGKETSSTEERERNTPQAFSHFTFVASDYRLMVVDIQGVDDQYTDPQIHTADGRGFGAGNLGTFGMERFLESHRCNAVCKWLGLRSINERYKCGGTAAPLYEMPFGGAIKKSTNRITEERNTFSTSVTVSEAFGSDALVTATRDELSAAASSDAATTATGSSSMLYQQQQQLFANASSSSLLGSRLGFEPSSKGGGGGPGGSSGGGGLSALSSAGPVLMATPRGRGRPLKALELDDRGPAAWWLVLKRLLCCC